MVKVKKEVTVVMEFILLVTTMKSKTEVVRVTAVVQVVVCTQNKVSV